MNLQVLAGLELFVADLTGFELLWRGVNVGEVLLEIAIVAIGFSAFGTHGLVVCRSRMIPTSIPGPRRRRIDGEPRRTRPRPWNPIIHQSRCPNTGIDWVASSDANFCLTSRLLELLAGDKYNKRQSRVNNFRFALTKTRLFRSVNYFGRGPNGRNPERGTASRNEKCRICSKAQYLRGVIITINLIRK